MAKPKEFDCIASAEVWVSWREQQDIDGDGEDFKTRPEVYLNVFWSINDSPFQVRSVSAKSDANLATKKRRIQIGLDFNHKYFTSCCYETK